MNNDYDSLFQAAGAKYGIDPKLLKAQAVIESGLDPEAYNDETAAKGISQFIPATAKSLGVNPTDPASAIDGQARLLAENYKRYKDPISAVSAYHGGTDQNNWGPKTKAYVQKINDVYPKTQMAQNDSSTDPIDQEIQDSITTAPSNTQTGDPIDQEIQSSLSPQTPGITYPNAMFKSKEEHEAYQKEAEENAKGSKAFIPGVGAGLVDVPRSLARVEAPVLDALSGNAFNISQTQKESNEARNQELHNKYGDNGWFQAGRTGGNIAGTVPLMWAGGELAGAGALEAGVAPGVTRFMSGATSNPWGWAPSRMAQGAIQGTEVGALTNASTNKDPAEYTANNAEAGAILNPASQLGGKLMGAGANFAANKFAENGDPAAMALAKNLKADGYDSIDAAHSKLGKLGPDATWADLGPNTRDFMASVARQQGPAKTAVEDFVTNRQLGTQGAPSQNAKLVSTLKSGLGVQDEFGTVESKLASAIEDGPHHDLYKQAYAANPSMSSPEIDRILATPAGKNALGSARTVMLNSGKRMGIPDAELTQQAKDAGILAEGGVAGGLNLRSLDLVKRNLDDQATAAFQQGKTALGHSIAGVRDDLLDEMDNLDLTAKAGPNSVKAKGGSYAQARAGYSLARQNQEALDVGRTFMKGDSPTNDMMLDAMTPEQRKIAKVGAVQGLKDVTSTTPDVGNYAGKILNTPDKRERFLSLFDDPKQFKAFEDEAKAQQEKYATYASVKKGSQTAGRQAVDQNPVPNAVGIGADALSGNHANLFMRALSHFGEPAQLNPQQALESSKIMLGPTNEAAARLRGLGASGFGKRSFLPAYVKMLSSAYGIPATEMGANNFSTYTAPRDQSQ